MKNWKKILLVSLVVLVLSLDRQTYERVEYRLNETTGSYDTVCKDESSMLYHASSWLIGTTKRDKEAYELYCS